MRFGTDEQKDFFLPKILGGDIHFCDRLLGARRRHRPRVAHHARGARRRRIRDQRPEDVDVARERRRLRAGSRCAPNPEVKKHQGISIIIVPLSSPGITISPLTLLADHDINQVFFDDVRRAGRQLRRRREQRLDPHHQPAQPRASDAVRERRRGARARRGPAVGAGDEAAGASGPRDRPGLGTAQPGAACTRTSRCCAS